MCDQLVLLLLIGNVESLLLYVLIAMIAKLSPCVVTTCLRQIQVLKHERQLNMNGKFFLYKDHHRRLFHVIISVVGHKVITLLEIFVETFFLSKVVQIVTVVWVIFTVPYVIQIISMVAGLNAAIELDELPNWHATIIVCLYRSLPLINCLLLMSAFLVNLSLKF